MLAAPADAAVHGLLNESSMGLPWSPSSAGAENRFTVHLATSKVTLVEAMIAMGFEEFALTVYSTEGGETLRPSRYGARAWRAGYAYMALHIRSKGFANRSRFVHALAQACMRERTLVVNLLI